MKKQSAGKHSFSFFKQPRSPFYCVRIMYGGQRRKFSTGETSLVKAKSKAVAIMADIRSRGFAESIQLHARRVVKRPTDPTFEEFEAIYRDALRYFDRRPNPITVHRYCRSLERVCRELRVKRVQQLNTEKIELLKKRLLDQAPSPGHSRDSARVSINSLFRNAAAMFSIAALRAYSQMGLDLTNPFGEVARARVRLTPYSPLSKKSLDELWQKAALLRDGDPHAIEPDKKLRKRERIDFREPQIGPYLLLILELGLGLRRNEADKAEWSWLHQDESGRYFLEVRDTDLFKPKSRERRVIPVEESLANELLHLKSDDRFIVPGRLQLREGVTGKEKKTISYRCDVHHRVLCRWLRNLGFSDLKPCHRLRKEFGSYVATSFGLFHAQKFLGHSSPVVTDAYYAGLTDLPELSVFRGGIQRSTVVQKREVKATS